MAAKLQLHTGGRLIFSTGHFSIFGVGYKASATAFTDIKGHWARENMEFAASRGLLTGQGMSSYTVSSFSDVKSGSYYLPYIE